MLSFFPQDVLDEILNLIESVSEGFPTYSHFWIVGLFIPFFSAVNLLNMCNSASDII